MRHKSKMYGYNPENNLVQGEDVLSSLTGNYMKLRGPGQHDKHNLCIRCQTSDSHPTFMILLCGCTNLKNLVFLSIVILS